MSADPEQQKIDELASERNKKLDVLSRVSPTMYNDAKTRERVSESYDREIEQEEEKYIQRKTAELEKEQKAEQQKIDAENKTRLEEQRKTISKPYDDQLDELENEKQQKLAQAHASVWGDGGSRNRSELNDKQNIIIKNYKSASEKVQREKKSALNQYDYSVISGGRTPDASVSRAFHKSGGQMSLIDLQSRRDEARQAKSDYDSKSSAKGAQSAAIIASEDASINAFENSIKQRQSQKDAQAKDAAKANVATLNALGVPASELTKSGDLGIVFRAAPVVQPVEKTNEQKSQDVLQSYQDYKDDKTSLTQPNASNYLPIEVPEPKKTNTSMTQSEYYSIWNETHPQQKQDETKKDPVTITSKSEKLLNQYFLYQHGLTSLTDDVASDGKPRILPTPKKEDMQNEIAATAFYKNWTERYGDITRNDLESAGIFSDPEKLNRIRELNEQQKNVTTDPAALLLKDSIDFIANQKYQQVIQSESKQSESSQSERKDIKIIREGLILIRNEDYAVIQTPNYTRLVVYPTESKDGYIQILRTVQGEQKPSYYVFDENLSEKDKAVEMWKTTNFLVDQQVKPFSEADQNANQYLRSIPIEDVVQSEKNMPTNSNTEKITDNDFFQGLTGHATELHLVGASVAEYAKGGSQEEIEGRIYALQNKLEYKPTGEASVITDIINRGRNVLFNEPNKPSETKKFVETSNAGYITGSIVGTLATAMIPVDKIFKVLTPLKAAATTKTATQIAERTIPKDIAYSIEVDKNQPNRAIVWVGSEEATKQTIRTQPKENYIADVESGTGRASFDVMKIDTKSKTVEFIKIAEASDKDKLISQIRMETRGTKTADNLGLKEYDTQGEFAYSQGYTTFKNIWDLSNLAKAKEVKQLATGEVRPLQDVKTNPELYGDIPISSTTENAGKRFEQFIESLEGGKEPRIAGRVGYFVEKPKDGKPNLITLPDDLMKTLEKKPASGTQNLKEQRETEAKLIDEYLKNNPRTYGTTQEPERTYSRPYNYDVVESELNKLTKDTSKISDNSKASTKSESKESIDIESIRDLISFEPSSEKSLRIPTTRSETKSQSKESSKSNTDTLSDIMSSSSLMQNISSKMNTDSLSDVKLKIDSLQGSKLMEDTKQKQRMDEDLFIAQKLIMDGKPILDLDLDLPSRLITDQPLKQDDDLVFMPRLRQDTDNDIPEKLLLKIPEIFTEKTPPFKLFLFDDDEEKEEPYKPFNMKNFKRTFLTNVPTFSAFGLLDGDELTLGKESKINKLEKKMLRF